MKLNILKARIKRNMLIESAGVHFRDEKSPIVTALNEEGKKALVGIQKANEIYTILGEQFVYFSTDADTNGQMPIEIFSHELHLNGLIKGKGGKFEFIKTSNQKVIWLQDTDTMFALWNTVLWLEKIQAK